MGRGKGGGHLDPNPQRQHDSFALTVSVRPPTPQPSTPVAALATSLSATLAAGTGMPTQMLPSADSWKLSLHLQAVPSLAGRLLAGHFSAGGTATMRMEAHLREREHTKILVCV